jgi:hypothetical protein
MSQRGADYGSGATNMPYLGSFTVYDPLFAGNKAI